MFTNDGFCYACNQHTSFTADGDYWRDHYRCDKCGSIPRERAVMYIIEKLFPQWRTFTIHESSPSERGTSLRLRNEAANYIPSQFYPDAPFGKTVNGYRNENLEDLSFADESIDLHVSQDVFEHLFHPEKAFQEIARTLKPGGAHVFTTPLVQQERPSQRCAEMSPSGQVRQLIYPREIHGNPVSEEGSLVTMHWGFDIVDYIYRSSGLITRVFMIDNLDFGIRADLNEVLVTQKPL